jgi:tetratricopeptide (TPR) repeat protein
MFLEQNNIEAMISVFTHHVDFTDKPNPAAFYHRAEVMALMGNLELSLNDFKKCIELDRNFINAYVHLARCYIGLDQIAEAETLIEKGLSLFPQNRDLILCQAEIFVLSGKVSEAQTLFNNVISTDPTCPQAYLSLAMASINQSDNKVDAEKHLLQALELDPNFQAAHLQLAHLLSQEEHRNDDAIDHFNKAMELAKNIQEMEAIVSLREASIAQNAVFERYPELKAKLK